MTIVLGAVSDFYEFLTFASSISPFYIVFYIGCCLH